MSTKKMQEHEIKLKQYLKNVKEREKEVEEYAKSISTSQFERKKSENNKVQFAPGIKKQGVTN